jgi:serine/threonine-protein kinase RsbW
MICVEMTAAAPATTVTITGATQIRPALRGICRWLDDVGCDAGQIMRAEIVLAEILNNIVEHALDGASNRIDVLIELAAVGLMVEVRDTGRAMPDRVLPNGPLPDIRPQDVSSWPEGGFGWAMIRSLAENLSYQRIGDENVVTLCIMARG